MVGDIPDNHLMEVRLFFNSFVIVLEDYIKIVLLRDKFNINVYDYDIIIPCVRLLLNIYRVK